MKAYQAQIKIEGSSTYITEEDVYLKKSKLVDYLKSEGYKKVDKDYYETNGNLCARIFEVKIIN